MSPDTPFCQARCAVAAFRLPPGSCCGVAGLRVPKTAAQAIRHTCERHRLYRPRAAAAPVQLAQSVTKLWAQATSGRVLRCVGLRQRRAPPSRKELQSEMSSALR